MVMSLKSNIQFPNNSLEKKKISIQNIVLCGLFAAILLVVQVGLAALPNIEFVSLLIIVYTLVFGKMTIPIIYIFALLEGLIYGFGIWWIMYLYVWTILYVITRILKKNQSVIFWAVVGGFFGLFYGALCSIPYLIAGGIGAGIAWWIRGIPYDILHASGNFISILLLFRPVYQSLTKLYKSQSM